MEESLNKSISIKILDLRNLLLLINYISTNKKINMLAK
jgi:hypothetical protein